MKKERIKEIFNTYVPWGCFILGAIEPALRSKEWLYNIVLAIDIAGLFVSAIVITALSKNLKDFSNTLRGTRSQCYVWLFISIVGVLVSYALDSWEMEGWIGFVILDVICILFPNKKIIDKK